MAKKKYIKDSKGVTVSVTTDTLGLEKPLLNENYDIDVHNRNMDRIDEDLTPIDDSYIIELFQHDGDISRPRDYYTKEESDEKYATKEEVESNTNLANQALDKANEAFLRGDNVKTQLVDKLISEGLDVSTNNTFEELIGSIALGRKWASGTLTQQSVSTSKYTLSLNLDFEPSMIFIHCSKTSWPTCAGATDLYITNLKNTSLIDVVDQNICFIYVENLNSSSCTIRTARTAGNTTYNLLLYIDSWIAFE